MHGQQNIKIIGPKSEQLIDACVISGLCFGVNGICVLLGYEAENGDVSRPSIRCPETSVKNYNFLLCNIPK